jgi:hypothetical protein
LEAKNIADASFEIPPSPRTNGWILGLIFGLKLGLGCDDLKLCRFLLIGPQFGVSDFLATGPLGEGIGPDRGLGATELGFLSESAAGLESKCGVTVADILGDEVPVVMAVSIRATWGRKSWVAGVAASGRITSSIISSCGSFTAGCVGVRL